MGVVLDDSYSGNQCFGDSDGGNSQNETENFFELIPGIDLSSAQTPIMSFMTKYSLDSGDRVELQVQADVGLPWETLEVLRIMFHGNLSTLRWKITMGLTN